MKFTAILVQILLWLMVAASPTLVGVGVGFIVSLQSGGVHVLPMLVCGIGGFVAGGLWAERVRRTTGLATFWGRLIGMKEL
jgi:hypothetical protein